MHRKLPPVRSHRTLTYLVTHPKLLSDLPGSYQFKSIVVSRETEFHWQRKSQGVIIRKYCIFLQMKNRPWSSVQWSVQKLSNCGCCDVASVSEEFHDRFWVHTSCTPCNREPAHGRNQVVSCVLVWSQFVNRSETNQFLPGWTTRYNGIPNQSNCSTWLNLPAAKGSCWFGSNYHQSLESAPHFTPEYCLF